jgi:hypothetical protein
MAKRQASPQTFIQRSRGKSPVEKALFHQVTGAGRSHVKRPFLGLTDGEAHAITQRLVAGMRENLANARRRA